MTDMSEVSQLGDLEEGTDDVFGLLCDSLDMGVVLVDVTRADHPLIRVNDGFLALTGYSRDEVLGRNCRFLQVPETDPVAVMAVREAIAEGVRTKVDLLNGRKNGERFWNRLELVPVRNAEGHVVRVAGLLRDVSSEVAISKELALQSSRLRAILDATHEGIITVGPGGEIHTYNSGAAQMFGYAQEEVIGLKVEVLLPESKREDHARHMATFAAGDDTAREMANFRRVIGRRKNGSLVPVMASISKATVAGEPLMTVVARDLTEVNRQEQALRKLADDAVQSQIKAEQANNAKSVFLANMSHELRTPLNAIIGFSDVMRSELFGAIGSEIYRDYVAAIHDSGQHLLQLISDVLDISKIEAGKIDLVIRPVDVAAETRAVTDIFRNQVAAKNLDFTIDLSPSRLRHALDSKAFRQILMNLLSNAIKFTEPGGAIDLSVRLEPKSGDLCLSVSDTGIGIPPDKLDTLGQPFEQVQRAETADGNQGTGLGLAISRSLAELHGGGQSLSSEVGRGTRVEIRFPKIDHRHAGRGARGGRYAQIAT